MTLGIDAPNRWWPRLRSTWAEPVPSVVPPRLWIVIVLIGLTGVVIVVPSLFLLLAALSLFTRGPQGAVLAVFALVLLAIPLTVGLSCVYLARRIQQGDRLARVIAIVLCVATAAACLLTGARDLGWVVAGLLGLGAAALLGLDPVVKSHFTGNDARYGAEPATVVAARALMVLVAACVLLVGALFIPLGFYAPSLIVYGIIDVVIAFCVFYLSRRLAAADAAARVLTTGLALVYVVNSIVAGHGEPGVILPVGLALGVIGLLWVPESSRRHFATLQRPRQPAIAAVDRAVGSAVEAALTAIKGSTPEGGQIG